MAQLTSKTFSAAAQSSVPILLKNGQQYSYALSGTFVATIAIERSGDGGLTWALVTSFTATGSGNLVAEHSDGGSKLYRATSSAYTSGSPIMKLNSLNVGRRQIHSCGVVAKAGTTSGWVVAVGDNICLSTCPASKTASTLVVPIRGLSVGDRINGFHLIGQIESAGGTVTVDCALHKHTAVAADVTDTTIASITQLSVIAQTVMSAANTSSPDFPLIVADGETYFFLITATTGSSCDIALQGIAVFMDTVA